MYSSCSVHWVMQAEMPPAPPPPHPLLSPPVNRHRRGQERPDLFRGWHHNKKGGPERHRLHFPGIQRPDVGSASDVWQQHGHQSGDLHGNCQTLLNPLRALSRSTLARCLLAPPTQPWLTIWYAGLHNRIYIYIMLPAPLLTWITIMLINCSQSYFTKLLFYLNLFSDLSKTAFSSASNSIIKFKIAETRLFLGI